ncbi:MAG: hypothetical protein SPK87_01795, partial [Bacteroidales bacterium]|nr:hypothetical protein [Bacteroidales bacterium]
DDTRILNYILYEAKTWKIRVREDSVRVGPVGNIVHGGKSRFIGVKIRRMAVLSKSKKWGRSLSNRDTFPGKYGLQYLRGQNERGRSGP